MDSKKVNLFAVFMVVVMCIFSVYISMKNNKGEPGQNGSDMTIETLYDTYKEQNPSYTGTLAEFIDYYISGKDGKDGEDGKDLTVSAVYEEYKTLNPTYTGSLAEFIEDFLANRISFVDEISKQQLSAQTALCSTVDICFPFSMEKYYGLSLNIDGNGKYIYKITESTQPLMSVAAGSGVIYKKTTNGTKNTAYIITNYHVVFVETYSNDDQYSVFYNNVTGKYFTGKATETLTDNYLQQNKYVYPDKLVEAPVDVHFLDSYNIYLNGYQSKDYALSASFVGGSAENDIAVLKIEYDSAAPDQNENNKLIFEDPFTAVTIKDSDDIQELDYVIPVGNPLIPNTSDIDMSKITTYEQYLNAIEQAYINSLCLTTTGGRISQISCVMPFASLIDDTKTNNMRLIQVDAAINPGNSGGGLYDIDGNLIGIVNGKIVDTNYDNVGFAIPINIASRIADQVISQCDNNEKISIYKLNVEKLGLTLKEVVGEENKPQFNVVWNYAYDIVIDKISPLSSYKTYFEAGDIIKGIKFEGETEYHNITRDFQLNDLLLMAKYPSSTGKTTISFKVLRDFVETSFEIEFSASDFKLVI